MTRGQERFEEVKSKLLSVAREDGATPKEGGGYRIVFLGDSITSAEWVHPNWREIVEYVLKQEFGYRIGSGEFGWKLAEWGIRCFNAGFDGATTEDMLQRLDTDVLVHNPDMVIVCGGDNDMHLKRTDMELKESLSKIVSKLESSTKGSIYMSPPSGPASRANDEENLRQFMKPALLLFPRDNMQFIDLFLEYKKFDTERFFTFVSIGNEHAGLKPGDIDFLHPNQLGNAYIAKIVLEHGFGISFDPDLYIEKTLAGEMFPSY